MWVSRHGFFGLGSVAVLAACSSTEADRALPGDGSDGGAPIVGFSTALPCTDTVEAVYGAPPAGFETQPKGAILRCTRDPDVAGEALLAAAQATGYTGKGGSGARVYRVAYRTERGTEPPTPGYGVATIYVPTTPRAERLPTVVVSRGSRGQGAACAPSLGDPKADAVKDDYTSLVLPLVGDGYAVIAPDLAGYANFGAKDNPPSAYGHADDVMRSTLDGARALQALLPGAITKKTVLVGFSQGGHTSLASLALAPDYGYDGELVGVVAYSPLWFNQAIFGAAVYVAESYPIATSPGIPNSASLWYHYTVARLLDGRDAALASIVPEKREAFERWATTACWGEPSIKDLGATLKDLYTPEFQEAVGAMGALNAPCPAAEPVHGVCETWRARYRSERPRFRGAAAAVPILVVYGGKDTALSNRRMMCAIDRLKIDGVPLEVCVDPEATHGGLEGIARRQSDYVAEWIAHAALGASPPGPCASDETGLVDEKGTMVTCEAPPPNDADL